MASRDALYADKRALDNSARSKTTPVERQRESGKLYGSDNTSVAAASVESDRESGRQYGSGNTGIATPPVVTGGNDGAPSGGGTVGGEQLTYSTTIIDPDTGDTIDIYIDGKGNKVQKIAKAGTKKADDAKAAADKAAEEKAAALALAEDKRRAGQSAYDILYNQFSQYGLGSLVEPLKDLITRGTSQAEFTLELRKTDAYKKRFAANAQRVAAGLSALDEADYIALEDQYQNIMRSYGLPDLYWKKDEMGTQAGFTQLLANDVSAIELENRVQQASDFIDKGPKAYVDAIKQFYPEISRGDLMAYVLDPKNALPQIQTKIGAAKIGGEYLRAGIDVPGVARAESLLKEGVTAEKARLGAQAIKETAPRGGELAALYGQGPYGATDVEEEVYGLGGATEAKKKREKIAGMEQASFSKQTGNISTALSRNTSY